MSAEGVDNPSAQGAQPSRALVIGVAAAFFALAILSRGLAVSLPGYRERIVALPYVARWLEEPVRIAILVAAGPWLVHGWMPAALALEVGLTASPHSGVLFALTATMLMLLGVAIALAWSDCSHA